MEQQIILGRGVYTYSEVSRLLDMSVARIKGLVNGYKYKEFYSSPVIRKRTVQVGDKEYLSFLDLIEIKFIKHFMDCGITRNKIVKAYEKAREDLKKEHPFATKFTTEGKFIYADDYKTLLNLESEQLTFRPILEKNLKEGIDFANDMPRRWRPFPDLKDIILDPEYKYGKPIIIKYNVPTNVIFDAYVAENKNAKKISEWYGVPLELVQQAVQFELRLS